MKDRTKLYVGLLVILGTIALSAWQWNEMDANLIKAAEFTDEAQTQSAIKENLIEDYQEIKVEVNESRETALQELDLVFPTDEDLTNLTRTFDEFATANNFASNPFFISSINYQNTVSDDSGEYRYVPVSVSIETSKKNLGEFIEFIETSGSLEGETRLMSIEEITVGYPEEYGGTYSVRFTINAYFTQEI